MKQKQLTTGAAAAMLAIGLVILSLLLPSGGAAAESAADAEWTVMFYLCGSDLESKYSYATENLTEIANCWYPESLLPTVAEDYDVVLDQGIVSEPGTVNVVIQTGGCREWHAEELGMEVDPSALQRWSYHCYPDTEEEDGPEDGFILEDTAPLASMADAATLSYG